MSSPHNQTNWAGNYTYGAANIHRPQTLDQLREIVVNSRKVKALGTRHSFNNIADTSEDIISLENFTNVVDIDRENSTVTVEAGARYGQLCQYLNQQVYALHNMASLPHISVAGAIATATHGSGNKQGNLSTAVTDLEILKANGESVTVSRESNAEQFYGAVVGLGGLGIVTKLTLKIEPEFEVRQDLYENLPMAALEANYEQISSSAYSVSLFTDWRDTTINQVWLKRRVGEEPSFEPAPELFGATLAKGQLHPIPEISGVNCTQQLGIPGPSFERLPHFRMDFTPSSGEELQSEYFVARHDFYAALKALEPLRERIAPLLQISEIRTIAADDLWMSPCYRQDSVAFHFTWHQKWDAVKDLLPFIEAQLEPFNARPHWGKLFTMSPEKLQSRYVKLAEFRELLTKFDPEGKFRNDYLNTHIFG